jgi:hypothetical protein
MTSALANPRIPNIPLATVYQRTARDGRTYLVGRVGNAKLLIVPTEQRSRGDRVWQVLVTEGAHAVASIAGIAALVADADGGTAI